MIAEVIFLQHPQHAIVPCPRVLGDVQVFVSRQQLNERRTVAGTNDTLVAMDTLVVSMVICTIESLRKVFDIASYLHEAEVHR